MATGGDDSWERAQGRKVLQGSRSSDGHQVSYLDVSIQFRSLCRASNLFVMMSTTIPGPGVLE